MSETRVFLLPDLGEGLTEAELVSWHVAVGDSIEVDQPIAEVETAKSAVEVPSPYAGIVAELHGKPGETLDVGMPLISVTPVGSSVPAAPVVEPVETELGEPVVEPDSSVVEPVETKEVAQSYREEEKAGSGNVLIGYGTPGGHGVAKRTRARKSSVSVVEPASVVEPVETSGVSTGSTTGDELALLRTRVPGKLGAVISPLVRRMAREHGVDLGDISGSGDSGLIMRRDVEAAISAPVGVSTGSTTESVVEPVETKPVETPVAEPEVPGSRQARSPEDKDARTGLAISSRTPVRGVRKAVAANMSRSRSEIPEATVWVDVDATGLLELRAGMKASGAEVPGLLAFIARFVTAGLKKYPELNTRIETADDGSQEIVGFDGINLGFAAQTDRGLVVPSVRAAEKLSARELDAEIRRLTDVARQGKATPAELGGGTFTLNNYGVFGVDGSAAIINHPEVGILGVGRIIAKPWVVNGELAVRKVTELTLTFDHRVCDGGTAAGFLRFVADAIENPQTLLADI
ncbi:catalytic domain of components of various dehydrogenase complexes [Pseudarthrobacter chlorophenolicus A6]|uniref:Dihydrolipoamide acetyltransferase component of pyruvate dehydrogenase complex n=1 Tax=Pseudarthrobacter chlorophenolicus (strain ATCC 700700 / DSM 12829 / CIP 107037 / JCM 12360 / KCTC 9906 / NCIMB 13794 / A6) TaxID=452863 RepID=B8HEC2_PSECP|nr:dihydrolipoamide acetyltransferase family protein [Pseudarthrobacter chlorophenolicus]ACL40867.1 catalytic domain of components of various dehydrogenase complexes [Pseudarthrobacter chlorophenolicus A6]SDQ73726.1 pyruvate dehydrogenase E2 component (dihydrolipoamide acetyltransferase) [Pseudarthrobacter chlorophenolicus]